MQPAALEPAIAARTERTEALAVAARDLEASFLSVMLREVGAGAPRSALGGGIGETQFASFLTDIYAREIAQAGGIGLAENIFRALARGAND